MPAGYAGRGGAVNGRKFARRVNFALDRVPDRTQDQRANRGHEQMGFELIGAKPRGPREGSRTRDDGVMVASYPSVEGTIFSLHLRFGLRLVERLGWTVGTDRIAVAEGTGRDAGFLRLTRSERGLSYALSIPGGKARMIPNGGAVKIAGASLRHHLLPRASMSQTPAEFQAFGGELLVLLPEWIERIAAKEG